MSHEMTDCPVCKNEVPKLAPRCKHCFSDLTEHWSGGRKTGNPVLPVVILGLLFAASGIWVYHTLHSQQQLGQVTVDPKEKRVVLVYTSVGDRPTTRQVYFDEIDGIEMTGKENPLGATQWNVNLVTRGGERVLVNTSRSEILDLYATNLATHVGKPLTVIDKTGKSKFDFTGI